MHWPVHRPCEKHPPSYKVTDLGRDLGRHLDISPVPARASGVSHVLERDDPCTESRPAHWQPHRD
jgi:hypothetical protein